MQSLLLELPVTCFSLVFLNSITYSPPTYTTCLSKSGFTNLQESPWSLKHRHYKYINKLWTMHGLTHCLFRRYLWKLFFPNNFAHITITITALFIDCNKIFSNLLLHLRGHATWERSTHLGCKCSMSFSGKEIAFSCFALHWVVLNWHVSQQYWQMQSTRLKGTQLELVKWASK